MNVSKSELREAAEAALRKRKKVRTRLLGYCFQNAEALSKELHERDIPHELEYVGLRNLIFQEQYELVFDYTDEFKEYESAFRRANETGEYARGLPATRSELTDSAKHYIITVPDTTEDCFVVEICSETQGDKFRDIYIDNWPEDEYLRLKDGALDKTKKFDHF